LALNKATDLEGMKGFDVDLKFGKHFEELIDDIFSGKYKCEVKTERDKWIGYGNMVVETGNKGKPSGLTRTEADVWLHNFAYKGDLMFSVMFPTDVLKEVVEYMKKEGISRSTKGGDGWRSELELLPLEHLLTSALEVVKQRRRDNGK
jgi:hypothetical protein